MYSDKNFLISIIIPAYNVENLIAQTLISVCKQIKKNETEIIIINDGSTDKTELKIKEYIEKHSDTTIRYLNQINQGLSAARNTGLAIATGKYLTFLDSDDMWADNYMQVIRPLLDTDFDIIDYNCTKFTQHSDGEIKNRVEEYINGTRKEISRGDVANIFKNSKWYSWARVYKRELWKNIRFPIGRRFEDLATTPLLYFKANPKKILSIGDAIYLYRINPNGITHNLRDSDLQDIEHALKTIFNAAGKYSHIHLINTTESCMRTAKYIKYCMQTLNTKEAYANGKKCLAVIRSNISKESINSKNIKYIPYLYTPKLIIIISTTNIYLRKFLRKIKSTLKNLMM
ncbi:glycosyltransferase family 2 protein [Craterilacuibacter sp. RT1T]|uniref:glycosyltransferase family 2 protein n=1 Tax=Craterilacuibacter sp. RT1T TaxID=2942211 RepID=UPI0020BE9293|nr:glycosyltransferase family 2 protein [Craterilacuibacter sp. RT1T]MCL6263662.1 glycosyltransferase [Craterilacuibacter sp. RT1T]